MYIERVQLLNYGPIADLDIRFAVRDGRPTPILLVGENGSGKSILLSHIVNGALIAQGVAYPDSAEVTRDKVYKIGSPSYISVGRDFSFSRVRYGTKEVRELLLRQEKRSFSDLPDGMSGTDAENAFHQTDPHTNRHLHTDFSDTLSSTPLFAKQSVLYFPPDRFEEPAWLNEGNLTSRARRTHQTRLRGHTSRRVINYSPLRGTQDWFLDLLYDSFILEGVSEPVLVPGPGGLQHTTATTRYHGQATRLWHIALDVLQLMFPHYPQGLSVSLGPRQARTISLAERDGRIVLPNLFQLSSGEMSLLDLFLTLLRDFDFTGVPIETVADVRGIVVVDEIDLHLHSRHQYEVLPRLMAMFPGVQFVMSTHSPLLLLGLERELGSDGVHIHSLPGGERIAPEEFREFGEAYRALASTKTYAEEIKTAVVEAQAPVLCVEGKTDKQYFEKAIELSEVFKQRSGRLEVRAAKLGGGGGNLKRAWSGLKSVGRLAQPVVLLHDCDATETSQDWSGTISEPPWLFRRKTPRVADNPIKKGVENLFSRETLEKASAADPGFIDIKYRHRGVEHGVEYCRPEEWTVNSAEKKNLCDWICENSEEDDFKHFEPVLEVVLDVLGFTAQGEEASTSPN